MLGWSLLFTGIYLPAQIPIGRWAGVGVPTLFYVNAFNSSSRVPRLSAIPAARSNAAALKVRFFLIVGVLLFSSVMGIFAAVSWLRFSPPVVNIADAKPVGRAVAEMAATSFITGSLSPVPSAANVSPPIASTPTVIYGPLVWDGFDMSTHAGIPTESHRFLFYRPLVDATGQVSYQLMQLTVLVAVPFGSNPVLAARPFFAPAEYTDSLAVYDYSDREDIVGLPSSATTQLQVWGAAWAADDSAQLQLLTGDQTADVRYIGLGGYQLSGIRVITAIPRPQDMFLVRARVALVSANGSILEMDMDITVTAASTGLPNVVGWGPAGSGILLPSDVRISLQ